MVAVAHQEKYLNTVRYYWVFFEMKEKQPIPPFGLFSITYFYTTSSPSLRIIFITHLLFLNPIAEKMGKLSSIDIKWRRVWK